MEIRVNWEEVPAINQNGIITLYEIEYEPLETFNDQLTTEYVNTTTGSAMEITLDGLQEYVRYNITVRAYTIGPGPFNPEAASDITDEAGKMVAARI